MSKELLVVRSMINLNPKQMEDLYSSIAMQRVTGTVVLPVYCDLIVVPNDLDIKIDTPTYKSENTRYKIGDQISISLTGFGEFTATAQKHDGDRTLFIFDDCVASEKMNKDNTNKGGFDNTYLNRWLQEKLWPAFPREMKEKIRDLTIPTYGQMFGHDDWYKEVLEPDNDEQLPLMKKRKNRVADYNDEYGWYWLKNATKKSVSSSYFAFVTGYGIASSFYADFTYGVRPAFWLVD